MKSLFKTKARIYIRRHWLKKNSRGLLRAGYYKLSKNTYTYSRLQAKPTFAAFKSSFGNYLHITRRHSERGTGTKVLFSTYGHEFRVFSPNKKTITTITRTPTRTTNLLENRNNPYAFEAPKIIKSESSTIVEELIDNAPVDFVSKEMFASILSAYEKMYSKPNNAPSSKEPIQHGDFKRNNILWINQKPCFLIDFEKAQPNWYLYDIFYFLVAESISYQNNYLLDAYFLGSFDSQIASICKLFNEKFDSSRREIFFHKALDLIYKTDPKYDSASSAKLKTDFNKLRHHFDASTWHKKCAFSTADDKYATKSAAALLSIRNHNPDLDLYLIGRSFSDATKQMLNENNIYFIEKTLRNIPLNDNIYNEESYYWFAMPEEFAKLGYDHSLYVDGDTVTIANIMSGFPTTKPIAGVSMVAATYQDILRDELETIKNNWDIKVDLSKNRIHSGVLFFDNHKCAEINFFESIVDLLKTANKHGIIIKRDNYLFTLFQAINGSALFKNLPISYNFMEICLLSEYLFPKEIKVYHFAYKMPKPWDKMSLKKWLSGDVTRLPVVFRWKKYAQIYMQYLDKLSSETKKHI
ncbi:MAG: phosphotransferase [Candidatus Saccharimonadales bacterium]